MSSRSAQRSNCRMHAPIFVALLAVLISLVFSCWSFTASAGASYYKMVLCAAGNNAGQAGINTNVDYFVFQNQCGAGGFPAGNANFMRLYERQGPGTAWVNSYASVSWTAPGFVTIAGGGGYTRQENDFADGWRARFWGEGQDGGTNNFLMQGTGVANNSLGGIGWARTTTFGPHLWPFPTYGNYRRFVFEMTCFRPAGCDTGGFNNTDANSIVLILNDMESSKVSFTNTGSGILSGNWVKGTQNITWRTSERGSGIRFDRLRVDGQLRQEVDSRPWCDLGSNGATGEFGRQFQPCPNGSWDRSFGYNTASVSDGSHTVQVCTQDYGQAVGLDGSGGESCDQRSINVDNNSPGAPIGLSVSTDNPARYLSTLDAKFSLPANSGSPISKVHYRIVDTGGQVVQGERVVSATNPTQLKSIGAPGVAGDYRLQVWLEDQVGWVGSMASVSIPRDTVAPAAPQDISVTPPETLRGSDGFDVRWRNITDAGSPINEVHYEVLDGLGNTVVPHVAVGGESPQALADLSAPSQRGDFVLKMWLSDAEGNVGAPAAVPLSYRCVRSEVGGGRQLTAQLDGVDNRVVVQGDGAALEGTLRSPSGPVSGAPLCVFSNVVTDPGRDFEGLAITGKDGGYRFGVQPGPSRNLFVHYRPEHRELVARSKIETIVHPTFKVKKRIVRNQEFARFSGEIPGPHNDRVVIVLQARRGKGWIAFRRYRTRNGGKFNLVYRFHNTTRATKYVMRAQVRQTTGYPYLQGNSDRLTLKVLPARRVFAR